MATKSKKQQKDSEEFDYKTIKTFEDACKKVGVDPAVLPDVSLIPGDLKKVIIAGYKLLIIYRAINNGWKPAWSNRNQYKYYPWFEVLSSGFGFSLTHYYCGRTLTYVGSRLCTDSSDKALYIGKQFQAEYQDYFLYSK